MATATPEQLQLFKRRRAGALLIEVVALVLAPVMAVLAFVALGEQGKAPRIVAAITFVAIFLIGQLVNWSVTHASAAQSVRALCPVVRATLHSAARRVLSATNAALSSVAERSMKASLGVQLSRLSRTGVTERVVYRVWPNPTRANTAKRQALIITLQF